MERDSNPATLDHLVTTLQPAWIIRYAYGEPFPSHKPLSLISVAHYSPWINPSLSGSTNWRTSHTLHLLLPLSNYTTIPFSVVKPPENTFITPFIHLLRYSTQHANSLYITNPKVNHLHILILDLSLFLQTNIPYPYTAMRTSRHSCNTFAHSSCELLAFITFHKLTTFLWHSFLFVMLLRTYLIWWQ